MTAMVLEQLYGHVTAMTRKTDGSTVTVAASIADTVITVESTGDFDADFGGQVVLGPDDDVYDYTSVDEDASTITLATGLLTALDVDDRVDIYDPEVQGRIVDYVALVLLDEQDPGDEPIEVTVQHGLINMLDESVRGGIAEAVTLVHDGPDDYMIWQIDGKLAIDVALEATISDFDASMAELSADLTELNTVTLPGVQADLADAVADISSIQGLFPITSTSISDGAITTPKMTANSINGDRVTANTLNASKIVGLSITGDKIAGNTISGDKIIANSISASHIQADAINGKTITGAVLSTSGSFPVTVSGNGMGWTSGASIGETGTSLTLSRGSSAVVLSSSGVSISGLVSLVSGVNGDVSASGEVTGATLRASSAAPVGPTDGDAVRMGSSGRINRVTSAAKYKTDIRDADIDFGAWERLQVVTYRHGKNKHRSTGVIADQAAALGLDEWVGRVDGEIETFKYDGTFPVLLSFAQKHAREIRTLMKQIAEHGDRLTNLENA